MKKLIVSVGIACMLCGCIGEENSPKIEFTGGSTLQILLGDKFVEPGYKALDKEDGDVTEKVVVSGWDGDTSKVGRYTRVYSVTDSDGNIEEKSREIVITALCNIEKYSNGVVKHAKEGLADGSIIEYEKYENGEMKNFKRYKENKIVEECAYGTTGLSTASKYYNTRTENGVSVEIVYEYDYDSNGKTVESRMKKNGVLIKVGSYADDIKTKDVIYSDGKIVKEIEYYADTQIKKYTVYDDSGVIIFNEEYAKEDFTGKTEKEIIDVLLKSGYDVENEVETPGIKGKETGPESAGSYYIGPTTNWNQFSQCFTGIIERKFQNEIEGFKSGDKFVEKITQDDIFRKINEKSKYIDSNDVYIGEYEAEYRGGYNHYPLETKTEYEKYQGNFNRVYGHANSYSIVFGVRDYKVYKIKNLPESEDARKKYIDAGCLMINNVISGENKEIPKEYKEIAEKVEYEITVYATEIAENGVKIEKYEDMKTIRDKINEMVENRKLSRKNVCRRVYNIYWKI